MKEGGRWIGWVAGGVVALLLWLPLCAVVVYSFNSSRFGSAWESFTLEGYRSLWSNEAARSALINTLVVATVSTMLSTVLGSGLGYALARWRGRGRRWIESGVEIPVLIPDVVFAVGLTVWLSWLQRSIGFLGPGLGAMIAGHVTFQIPFVALIVRARASGLDPSIEEAARDLGASSWTTFFRIMVPLLAPGIVSGALLAFTLSLDDFAVSFFTGGPGSTTLPVLIYSTARRGIAPDMNALSTLMIVATLAAVMVARLWNRGGANDPWRAPRGIL